MCVSWFFSLGFLLTLSHIIVQDFSQFCLVYLSFPLSKCCQLWSTKDGHFSGVRVLVWVTVSYHPVCSVNAIGLDSSFPSSKCCWSWSTKDGQFSTVCALLLGCSFFLILSHVILEDSNWCCMRVFVIFIKHLLWSLVNRGWAIEQCVCPGFGFSFFFNPFSCHFGSFQSLCYPCICHLHQANFVLG